MRQKLIKCVVLLSLISYKLNLAYLLNQLIGVAEFILSVAYKTSVHGVTGRNLNLARSDFAIWKPLENYQLKKSRRLQLQAIKMYQSNSERKVFQNQIKMLTLIEIRCSSCADIASFHCIDVFITSSLVQAIELITY